MDDLIIVGSAAENPFVDDITQHMNQDEHYSDLISLKVFINSEFCPRFLVNEQSWENVGRKLEGKRVLIVSTTLGDLTRDEIAMRNFLIARAARDNGAARVILLEPDLFYSAQDRGPRPEHGCPGQERSPADYKKFDGQPFSARLYADLLSKAGVDEVVTCTIIPRP
jgi:ribose-phosphate pyrophosphokinase